MEEIKHEDVEATKEFAETKDDSDEVRKLKKLLSQKNSEIANYKRAQREKMSEDEKAAAEQRDRQEALEKELAILKHEKAVSENAAEFIKLGFEVDDAKLAAEDLVKGNMQKFFIKMNEFISGLKEKAVSEAMKDTPRPEAGKGSKTMTHKEFQNLSIEERYKFSIEHPDEYKEIYGGN